MKDKTRLVAPALFLAGYILLVFPGGWVGTLAGSVCIGFANGLGVPFIISTASRKAGKAAATTVMPLISMALYLAQFLTPVIMSGVRAGFGSLGIAHLPYFMAMVTAALFLIWSAAAIKIPSEQRQKILTMKYNDEQNNARATEKASID